MASYLDRYIGIYRVKAEYDQSINDFPRLHDGKLDPSFNDYYIPCKSKCKIKHAYHNNLSAYIPSIGRGHNILKEIYIKFVNENINEFINKKSAKPAKNNKVSEYTLFDYEKLYQELEKSAIIYKIDETDCEITFQFKSKDIEKIAEIMKPLTSGASIRPLSTKNLPKAPYKIPDSDLKRYKELTKDLQMIQISKFYNDFNEHIKKKMGKKYNISAERKKAMLKNKEFIHFISMWDEFCDFMQKEVDKLNKNKKI